MTGIGGRLVTDLGRGERSSEKVVATPGPPHIPPPPKPDPRGERHTYERAAWAAVDLGRRVDELEAAIAHVIDHSPGTPDSVKDFLGRVLRG